MNPRDAHRTLFAFVVCASAATLGACGGEGDSTLRISTRRTPAARTPSTDEPAADTSAADGSEAPPGSGGAAPDGPSASGGGGQPDSGAPEAGASGTDASTAPTSNATGGSGGPTGLNVLRSAGGLAYQINATAAAAPQGLLVLLHGSGASNYDKFVAMMERVATQYGLIRVSVLAPNGQGWNEGNQVQAAELLHTLIQDDLYPKYNIDKARVFFSGQSSGGGFLSSHFVPAHAKDYRGGAFLQCGAAPPQAAFAPDVATRGRFRLHFEITTGDTIWPDSYARAVASYTQAGMQLTKDNTKPGGHCAFDQQQVIVDHIGFLLNGP